VTALARRLRNVTSSRPWRLAFVGLALLLLASPLASGAAIPPLEEIGAHSRSHDSSDLADLHFSLVTIDVGNRLWDNFGHTALRMRDDGSGADILFNWGGFDASDGMLRFALRFFRGELDYRLFTVPTEQAFAAYRHEQRTIREDRINLSDAAKSRLHQRLLWNLEARNRAYRYDYFLDNCTTRVRDYLDEALEGRLRDRFTGTSQSTYRQVIWSHYASIAPVAMLLDIGMNGNIDRVMSEWQSLFLPSSLRRELLRVDSDVVQGGQQLPLLSDSRIVAQFVPPASQWNGYPVFVLLLAALLFALLLTTRKERYSRFLDISGQPRRSLSPGGYRVLGVLALVGALTSGTLGCLMLGSWFWSGHEDLHRNANLLLFWPTDLLGLAFALRLILRKSPWPLNRYGAPYVHYYLLAHLCGIAVHAIIGLTGLASQNTANVLLWLTPAMTLIITLIWLRGFRRIDNGIVL